MGMSPIENRKITPTIEILFCMITPENQIYFPKIEHFPPLLSIHMCLHLLCLFVDVGSSLAIFTWVHLRFSIHSKQKK